MAAFAEGKGRFAPRGEGILPLRMAGATPFIVDCRDLARFAGWWLSDCSSPIWCDGHDTDTSGRVEFLDFAHLTQP